MSVFINGFKAADNKSVTSNYVDVKDNFRFYFGMDINSVSYRGEIYQVEISQ